VDSAGIERFASAVWDARGDRRTLVASQLVEAADGPRTMADAYAVQQALLQRRLGRGERAVGWKLGYTSLAMREQMNIAEPNFGALTDAMLLAHPARLPETVSQPRVEPEIALRFARDLDPAAVTIEAVLDAVEGAYACLEVVDSVWTGYRFGIEHNTADGSSAAYVVVGERLPPGDLSAVQVRLMRNGIEVGAAAGAAASGHPAAGIVWLVAQLAERGMRLQAGDLVITGGLTAATPLDVGDRVEAVFDSKLSVSVERRPVTC
jgi:2-keto-4-pentenoate hydratase